MAALRWPKKDPQERLDYSLTWEKEMLKVGDSLFESYWRIEDDPENTLTTDANGISGNVTYIWLLGGTPGVTYNLVNTVHTDAGRIYERTVQLTVGQL